MDVEYSFIEKVANFLENNLGLSALWADLLDSIFIVAILLVAAAIIDYGLKYGVLPLIRLIVEKTANKWDDMLVDGHVVSYVSHIIPLFSCIECCRLLLSVTHCGYIGCRN